MKDSFKNKFMLNLDDLLNIEDIADTDDDGIYHYIDKQNNVYSYDTFDEIWLDKNINQQEILKRINLCSTFIK